MVSHYCVSQLVLFVLIWLFIMLHLTRPKAGVSAPVPPAEPEPRTPKGHRSHEPKPFEGLTPKPYCALCEQETGASPPGTLVRPAPMPLTNRRPRTIDTAMHFCPHTSWDYRGGWGLAICAPTVIPAVAPGANAIALLATATFWRPTARFSTANRRRWSSACASWPAWLKGSVFAPRLGSSRWLPTRCCSG